MDKQKFPCVLQDFVPFGAVAQKASIRMGRSRVERGKAQQKERSYDGERVRSGGKIPVFQ